MSACLILVRHAQASFDHDHYDRLSALGERQAEALARWWRACRPPGPVRLLGGGLARHRGTAAPLLAADADAWSEEPGLAEFDHREIFYAQRPDLREPQALVDWKQAPGDYQRRFGETWQAALQRWMDPAHASDYREPWRQFRMRCQDTLARLLGGLCEGETVLAVTSSGPVAVALMAAWQAGEAAFPAIQGALYNAGITEFWRDDATLTGRPGQVNACPHLGAELRTLR